MHSKSNNVEIMINDNQRKLLRNFQAILSRYKIGLEISMKVSDLLFDCVHLLYYKCHNINPSRSGSYVDFPHWTKNKKTQINPIN